MQLSVQDLTDIGRGAAFLGTGGGGDPYIGRLLAMHAVQAYGMPAIVDVDDLADDALVCCLSMLGAPTVAVEKAACGDELDLVIRRTEKHLGRKADALIPFEIGGINSLVAVMVAARTGLPLVNADGMGRAFPEIQMVTFNIYGIPCCPAVVADEHLNTLLIEASSAKRTEELARVAAIEMGCIVAISAYPMTGHDVKRTSVRGTLSLALEIGQAIARGRRSASAVDELIRYLRTTQYYRHCRLLFDGKVVDIARETTRGFAIGHCRLAALDGSGRKLEVKFQNEYQIARENGVVRAIVPDLVTMVDRETAEPILTEALKYGQRIKVIGVSAPPLLRTPEALAVVGPGAFGLEEEFVPIERL